MSPSDLSPHLQPQTFDLNFRSQLDSHAYTSSSAPGISTLLSGLVAQEKGKGKGFQPVQGWELNGFIRRSRFSRDDDSESSISSSSRVQAHVPGSPQRELVRRQNEDEEG